VRYALVAALVAGIAAALAAAAPAAAAPGSLRAPGQPHAAPPGMSVTITSVNPPFATPKAKVTVSGTITNGTATTVTGLLVQLWSSGIRLPTTAAMDSYLATQGPSGVDSPTGALLPVASVTAHSSQTWSLTLRVSQVGMNEFGVYPLAAELSQAGLPVDTARTFLPFWPAKAKSGSPKPVSIAWIWPLIDAPHQVTCPALLNNGLATSLAGGGRLGQLLAVGASSLGRRAALTWAIDPALLSDAKAMTARYRTGGSAACSGGTPHPASPAAQAWLTGVRSAAARQDFFITPYADVDVAALAHHGLDTELAGAFTGGRAVAKAPAILGQVQRSGPGGGKAGTGGTGLIAWPPDGIADYGVLETLAANGIGTVVLNSTMMPASPPVTTIPNGVGGNLHVLLADNGVQQILAQPPGTVPGSVPGTGGAPATASPSAAAAAAFAREQWFLAQTAMIASEAPANARALIVAPPRRWNPGTGLARALLSETVSTPWLHPASLASLVTAGHPAQTAGQGPPEHQVSPGELRAPLLRQVRRLDAQIRLMGSVLAQPGNQYLSTAVDAVVSTAWGDGPLGRRTAEKLLHRIGAYVSGQEQQISIVDPVRVTLGGKSGEVPVSISNHNAQPITVQLRVAPSSPGRITIGNFNSRVVVAGGTQKTIKIPVRASGAGSTTLTLWLTAPDGRVLPGSTVRMTVEATHFGTAAIVIIGIALAVFVLTAAGRALRRGSDEDGGDGGDADGAGEAQEQELTGPDPAYTGQEADTVEPERAGRSGSDAAKEPDEHAGTPGWAESR
jgi:Family of unknown function (DUF6049)